MPINYVSRGAGKPLILVHGLGSSRNAWSLNTLALAQHREVVLPDLPGHGESEAEADSGTFAGLARSFEAWLDAEGLVGADMVGSSMGARLVLEMGRRGKAGAVIALDPGGFWSGWEREFLRSTLTASGALLRSIRPALPALARNSVSRSMLLAQLAARPWDLNGDLVAKELASIANTATFDSLVQDLAYGPPQSGPSAPSSGPVVIGWGRHDRLCFPSQAQRAQAAFPDARLVWFERSGHFPMWEEPERAVRLILETIAS
jgi:pimeloyl-ACP methyl ester carboxylesterase